METCLPGDDIDVQTPFPGLLGIASNPNLSSSLSSLSVSSLHSPTDKDCCSELSASMSGLCSSSTMCGAGASNVISLGSSLSAGLGSGSGSSGRVRHSASGSNASSASGGGKHHVGSFKRKDSQNKDNKPADDFE